MSDHCFEDEEWARLYPLLHTRIARWVCTSYSPSWMRQRHDIIEDIVGETIVKVAAYAQQAERGVVREIDSLEKIATAFAYHCYVDALRRDRRMVLLIQNDQELYEQIVNEVEVDPSGQAIDNIYYELLLIQDARRVVTFPKKQRVTLLIDVANRMSFNPFQPTPLQEALAPARIDMRHYQKSLPHDKQACARHAAHLSLAYKRLALLAYMQRYMLICVSNNIGRPAKQELMKNESKETCYAGR